MTTNALTLTLASGDALDVREFAVDESLSRLFEVRLTAHSTSVDVDFEAAIGQAARFEVLRVSPVDGETRSWSGICADIEQLRADEEGVSTYSVRIVPELWLLSHRRNYRIFQDMSELDVALEVLSGWGIQPTLNLDAGSYPKRRMRVQYAETDLDFMSRMLEDIGVTYFFDQSGGETVLVLSDCPNKAPPRVPVTFVDKPNDGLVLEWVTALRTGRHVRPGRYTQSDVDYRKALNYPLAASASAGNAVEASLERYHHNYGSFLWKTDAAGDTPFADDRGPARTNEREGAKQVQKRLDAHRVAARTSSFHTNAHDLRPGKVMIIAGHPRGEVAAPLLVVRSSFGGTSAGGWVHTCDARYTDVDYRPELVTRKPRTLGVESATVTGPPGEEIHTDEFGRLRVHFHWDRAGSADEKSSCWVPQSQPWAGAGFGSLSLARVGQEVLVDFLGADPDRPVVVGRVFTTTTPPPYQLPKYKMVSGHRSESYPRPKRGGPRAGLGGGPGDDEMARSPLATPTPPGAPAGGGLPVTALGGEGDGGAVTPFPPAGGPPMPGTFGAHPASFEDLANTIQQNASSGPDDMDHHRSANGLVQDDTAGNEAVYLQAQKNLHETVKADRVGAIGGNRAVTVLGNDSAVVRFYQSTEVGLDRSLAVGGIQSHFVKDDIIVQGMKNHYVLTQDSFASQAVTGGMSFDAKQGILLRVDGGKATILMTPSAIVIDAPKVYINPGETFMSVVNKTGDTDAAEAASQKAAADRAAQIAANEKQISQLERDQEQLGQAMSYAQGPLPASAYADLNQTTSARAATIAQLKAQNAALQAQSAND